MKRHAWLALWMSILLLCCMGCSLPNISIFPQAGPLKEVTLEGKGDQKVLVISISGFISAMPRERLLRSRPSLVQEVVTQLKRAEQDSGVKALLLKVNTPGGGVTASDILYNELSAYKERSGVKIVAAMMNLATSGGYYVSLPADWIMAHPTTVTGSIGVIFARPGYSGFMEKFGFDFNVSKSGEHKDMGSPFRPSNPGDEAIFQSLTDQMAERFHGLVTKHRQITPQHMAQIASARIYMSPEAKRLGLVDQLGYLGDAIAKAKSLAGLDKDARVITYKRHESKEEHLYSLAIPGRQDDLAATASALSTLIGTPEAGFYYMWPAAMDGGGLQ